jgi:tetratricopeptide (TPR) repeat protein
VLKQIVVDLQTALRLNPHAYLYHLSLADAYDALSRPEDALKSIQEALKLAPHHEEPRLALGIHWHRLGQWQKAEEAYLWAGQASALNPKDKANWLDSYRLMLRHVALMRSQTAPRP